MEKKGTLASPATALARRVLPVPGGPTSRTPLGILAPIAVYRPGFFRKSTTSDSSSLASSSPATSLKFTCTWPSPVILALDLPKLMTRPPPPWVWFIIQNQTAMRMIMGSRLDRRLIHHAGCSGGLAVMATLPSLSLLRSWVSLSGMYVANSVPSFIFPVTALFVITTEDTFFFSTCEIKSL